MNVSDNGGELRKLFLLDILMPFLACSLLCSNVVVVHHCLSGWEPVTKLE